MYCLFIKYIVFIEFVFDGVNLVYVIVVVLKDNIDLLFKFKLSGNDIIELKGRQYGDGDFLNIFLGCYEIFQIVGLMDFMGIIVQSLNLVFVLLGNIVIVVLKFVDLFNIFDVQIFF